MDFENKGILEAEKKTRKLNTYLKSHNPKSIILLEKNIWMLWVWMKSKNVPKSLLQNKEY